MTKESRITLLFICLVSWSPRIKGLTCYATSFTSGSKEAGSSCPATAAGCGISESGNGEFYSCLANPGYTGCQSANGATVCFCDFEDDCNQSKDYIKQNSGPQLKCYSGSNGMYELQTCGPAADYVCSKQTLNVGDLVGKYCFPRSSLQGSADGSCSEEEGALKCFCDSDGCNDAEAVCGNILLYFFMFITLFISLN